jgi:hypothetical protein
MKSNREEIRNKVFARDSYCCVFCKDKAVDAHHLLERRLWQDGGYIEDNLISVCADCHMLCEETIISVEEGRKAANITNVVVPEHMYADQSYDKWGNPILENGRRAIGELFYDESVQKVLASVLDLFDHYVKYPRTYHLPWSYANRDDRKHKNTSMFDGKQVVVTLKMDGECTTMYSDNIHARSIDGQSHRSQSWVRNFWANNVSYMLPSSMRICGENVYATHSIEYKNLQSYFYGFSVWENDKCLSWRESIEWFKLFDITYVPVLYEGIWDEDKVRRICFDSVVDEGYVVRLADAFDYKDFANSTAKYVRKGHLQTPSRWGNMFKTNSLGGRYG